MEGHKWEEKQGDKFGGYCSVREGDGGGLDQEGSEGSVRKWFESTYLKMKYNDISRARDDVTVLGL